MNHLLHPDSQDYSPMNSIVRVLGVILSWLGAIKLGDWQAMAGIFSAGCVGCYALLQAYVLWRDKINVKETK